MEHRQCLSERQQYFLTAMGVVPWVRRSLRVDQVLRCAVYRCGACLFFIELSEHADALSLKEQQLLNDLAFARDASLESLITLTDTENHLDEMVDHESAEVWCFGRDLARSLKKTAIRVARVCPRIAELIERPLLKREI